MTNGPVSAVGPALRAGPLAGMSQGSPAEGVAVPAAPAATPPPAPDAREQAARPDAEAVKQAAERIAAYLRSAQRDLDISVDKDTGIVVVKVVDRESGEVIRQIPPEEVLSIAKHLDSAQGVLLRSRV